ncbi:MAG: DUF177 domain-containing protein [Micropepsaceae bacterium]
MTDLEPGIHRWIDPAGRSAPQGGHAVTTTEAERAAIARWLDVPAVKALSATLDIRRSGAAEAEVAGVIKAEVELVCGVSLDPFVQAFAIPVEASFRKAPAASTRLADSDAAEEELDLDADEPRPWTQHGIDLGALIAEELSLALPDFPRKPGAELPAELPEAADDKPPNPFAVLKGLTEKP